MMAARLVATTAALVAVLVIVACGDNRAGPPIDAPLIIEADVDALGGTLFGEPCTQPTAPAIGVCHDGDGACHDEPSGAVCRPFCHVNGVAQCAARSGVESITDRGACVCVPP